ncbi:MAG: alkaline phosphatase family protein, partial [Chitinophagaceae bacterium]
MQKFILLLLIMCSLQIQAQRATQSKQKTVTAIKKPKLIVGVVVDQMRWDYLYHFYDRYQPNGGFRRMLTQGFSNENAFISYKPTVTACGHATVYTGSVPAIHGITGNAWWDYEKNKNMYCTEDKTVTTLGASNAAGEMSPRNMLT